MKTDLKSKSQFKNCYQIAILNHLIWNPYPYPTLQIRTITKILRLFLYNSKLSNSRWQTDAMLYIVVLRHNCKQIFVKFCMTKCDCNRFKSIAINFKLLKIQKGGRSTDHHRDNCYICILSDIIRFWCNFACYSRLDYDKTYVTETQNLTRSQAVARIPDCTASQHLRGSRDVIGWRHVRGHVTSSDDVTWPFDSPYHFLFVVLWNGVSKSSRFRDL